MCHPDASLMGSKMSLFYQQDKNGKVIFTVNMVVNILSTQNPRNCDLISSWFSRKTFPDSDPRWLRDWSDTEAVSTTVSSPVWLANCSTYNVHKTHQTKRLRKT